MRKKKKKSFSISKQTILRPQHNKIACTQKERKKESESIGKKEMDSPLTYQV